MGCRRVKEREIQFDSHMSGFVYKVQVHGQVLIKKEIPGPDTVDEFLYEINALNSLRSSRNVIQFYGVVVDDREEHVRGILISYAEQGALVDVLYDNDHSIDWPTREKWARQIVAGLSEIHEAGFVQGDFTLSNIVIDHQHNAKIIDINRRGCPVGWEPPEATPLIESNQRISMYIGVKSDLFQLGMVLWALATQDDEPEAQGRPLQIDSDVEAPTWYCRIVEVCLSENPRDRIQALHLLSLFPEHEDTTEGNGSPLTLNDDYISHGMEIPRGHTPFVKTVRPPSAWTNNIYGNSNLPDDDDEEPYYPQRGRSPPRPLPRNDSYGGGGGQHFNTWSDIYSNPLDRPSISEITRSNIDEESESGFSRELGTERFSNLTLRHLGPQRTDWNNEDASRPRSAPPPQGREKTPRPHRDLAPTNNLSKDDAYSAATDRTGKLSRPDSGKDMSEEHHHHPHHQRRAESAPRSQQHHHQQQQQQENIAAHDYQHEENYTTGPHSTTLGQADDLKGIGGFTTGHLDNSEERQLHISDEVMIVAGDEFGRELDQSLGGVGSGLGSPILADA